VAYNRDIIIEPLSGSIIFSGSAGATFSEIVVDDNANIDLQLKDGSTFTVTGSVNISGSADISLNVSGTLSTDDIILRGTLDLGTF
tara:strand:+ start:313 stop:570 length:258 start_codon:yes stop_codon:yes gene_type:complete